MHEPNPLFCTPFTSSMTCLRKIDRKDKLLAGSCRSYSGILGPECTRTSFFCLHPFANSSTRTPCLPYNPTDQFAPAVCALSSSGLVMQFDLQSSSWTPAPVTGESAESKMPYSGLCRGEARAGVRTEPQSFLHPGSASAFYVQIYLKGRPAYPTLDNVAPTAKRTAFQAQVFEKQVS